MEQDNSIFDFSVERIPLTNASAAIVTKTSTVMRDSDKCNIGRTPDGKDYVRWGGDAQMPYNIIDLIESDETLSTCQIFNAEVWYGSGLKYCTEAASKAVKKDVEDWLLNNPIADYFMGV